jgi:hypothetical protein
MEITPEQVVQNYGDWLIEYLNCPHQTNLLSHLFHQMSQCPDGTMEQVEKWVQEYRDLKWEAYFLTFMFHHIAGSVQENVRQMHKNISCFYGRLASRIVRRPRSPKCAHLLPRGVFFPDGPCYTGRKKELIEVTINDGLHFHGLILVPTKSRLKVPFLQHLRDKAKIYIRGNISRIHVEPIWNQERFVADYAGKAVKRGRLSFDDVLVLPRTGNELQRDTRENISGPGREIKDVMSAYNVSLETAQNFSRGTLKNAADQGRGKWR